MSFPLVCPKCGARSGPSVGICPFCKAAISADPGNAAGPQSAELAAIERSYDQGKLQEALSLAATAADDTALQKDVGFLLLYARILIEVEGPESKIKGLLSKAHLVAPDNTDVTDYLDVADAQALVASEHAPGGPGEELLKRVLRRSPSNVHALFLLGAHLFWAEGEQIQSSKLLEKAVQLRPAMLRAWGCLGALYKKLGNQPLAARAFQRCLALETDPEMRKFFEQQARP